MSGLDIFAIIILVILLLAAVAIWVVLTMLPSKFRTWLPALASTPISSIMLFVLLQWGPPSGPALIMAFR